MAEPEHNDPPQTNPGKPGPDTVPMIDPDDGAAPDEAADGTRSAPGSPRTASARSGRRGSLALATLLAAASTVFAVIQLQRADEARSELGNYARARETASAFGAAYLTYDARDVAASSERVLSLTTENFAKEFEETRSPSIEALFDEIGTNTEATTTDVFVTAISQGRARALVVVDVEASSAETPDQTLVDLTFVLDLLRDGDDWKVDSVSPAPRPDVLGGPDASSITTVPGATAPAPTTTGSTAPPPPPPSG